MWSVVSALKRLARALVKGPRRRRLWLVLVLAGVLAAATGLVIHEIASIDPATGKKVVSRTTYLSHDGAYKVTVITYSDGSKRELREEKAAP